MDPFTIGLASSGVSAAAQGIGQIFGNKKARKAQAKENEINRQFSIDQNNLAYERAQEQSNLAYQRDLEQWNRQNAYNDPSAQRARLEAAGINPISLAGSGSLAGNASSSPSYSPASAQKAGYSHSENRASDIASALMPLVAAGTQVASLQNMFAQNDLIKAQIRNTNAQTDKTHADTNRSLFDLSFLQDTRDINQRRLGLEFDIAGKREALLSQENRIKFSEAEIIDRTLPQAIELIDVELANAKKSGALLDQNYLYKVAQTLQVDLENQLAEIGVRSSDSLASRIILRAIRGRFPDWNWETYLK